MGIATHIPIASSGSFLITPNVGLMIWVLVVFFIVLVLLYRYVFPAIAKVLDDRAATISSDLDSATQQREEAEGVLVEYRERLAEARRQAEEIVERAQKAGEAHHRKMIEDMNAERDQKLEQIRNEVQAETRRALEQIRNEVASLTVAATEKVTRKTLTEDDQRRLIDDALSELDFSALAGSER